MKNKMFILLEAAIYYAVYLLSGIVGNLLSVAAASAVIGFEYLADHMLVDNAEFFSRVVEFTRKENALAILFANLAVLIMYIIAFRNRRANLAAYVGAKRYSLLGVISAAFAGFFAHGIISAVMEHIEPASRAMLEYEKQMAWMLEGNVLLLLLVVLLIAPLVEEIVFRGVLISTLQKVITPIGALLVTSVLFGMAHGNLVQGIYSSILGMLLGFVKIRSGSLWHSAAMHIAFNASNIIAVFGFSAANLPLWCALTAAVVTVLAASGKSALRKRDE